MSARRTKAYIVHSSNKEPVRIDEEELEKIAELTEAGKKLIFCKEGVVNPAFIVNIVMDMGRIREWQEKCRYGGDDGARYDAEGLRPLGHMYSPGGRLAIAVEAKTKELEEKLPKALPAG